MADVVVDPVHDPLSPTQKPASSTLEGKIAALIAVVGSVLAVVGPVLDELLQKGVLGDGKLAGIIGTCLAIAGALGLLGARTALKVSANAATAKAAALIAASQSGAPVNPPQA